MRDYGVPDDVNMEFFNETGFVQGAPLSVPGIELFDYFTSCSAAEPTFLTLIERDSVTQFLNRENYTTARLIDEIESASSDPIRVQPTLRAVIMRLDGLPSQLDDLVWNMKGLTECARTADLYSSIQGTVCDDFASGYSAFGIS